MKRILERFCCKPDEERTNLATPWSKGVYSYATNGHILCRVPRLEDVPEREDAPDSDKLFKIPVPPEMFALADMDLPALEIKEKTCPDCNGAGTEEHKCPECDGDGIVEFDNSYSDYEVDCKTCNGNGTIRKCERCNATGKIVTQNMQPTKVGTQHFQLQYLILLKDLPNCKIGPNPHPMEPAQFTFDGGDGLLMPMRI